LSHQTVKPQKQQANRAQELQRLLPITCGALEDALRLGGCPVCQALHKLEQRSLFSFLYEGMMSGPARQEFLQSGGFCPRHFRLARRVKHQSHGIGDFEIASLCRQLVPMAEKDLESVFGATPGRTRLGLKREPERSLVPGRDCIFCRDTRTREREIIEVLEGLIEDEGFAAGVAANGLCLAHGRLAMAAWKHPGSRRWLAETMARFTAELAADLRQFVRKHEAQHRDEPFGREADVVQRSVAFLLGLESLTES
jgi:Family of unknown function (DUF6062)